MRVRFHPEAYSEFEAAASYYEQQQDALGHRFISAIEATLQGISEYPDQWPLFEPDIHRRLVRVFPYSILYNIGSEFVLVIAVMHCHQKPFYWRHRISN